MKRKTALKKANPERHLAFKLLREEDNPLTEIITRSGKSVVLNLPKHFLFKVPYINEEYNKEIYRKYKENL